MLAGWAQLADHRIVDSKRERAERDAGDGCAQHAAVERAEAMQPAGRCKRRQPRQFASTLCKCERPLEGIGDQMVHEPGAGAGGDRRAYALQVRDRAECVLLVSALLARRLGALLLHALMLPAFEPRVQDDKRLDDKQGDVKPWSAKNDPDVTPLLSAAGWEVYDAAGVIRNLSSALRLKSSSKLFDRDDQIHLEARGNQALAKYVEQQILGCGSCGKG